MRDYYDDLLVDRNATQKDIRTNYRLMMGMCHPDKHGGNPQAEAMAEAMAKRLNEAHTTLSDPEKRAEYDRLIGVGSSGDEGQSVRDYYDDLLVDRNATQKDIRTNYRLMMGMCHPDKHGGNPQAEAMAEAMAKRLNEAHTTLSDPEKRAEYDRLIGVGSSGSAGRRQRTDQWQASGPPAGEVDYYINLHSVDRGDHETIMIAGESIKIDIPQGVEEGERVPIRVAGQTIYLVVNILPDDTFVRQGADLYAEREVKVADVYAGKAMTIFRFNRPVEFKLNRAILHGESICLEGDGLPFRQAPWRRGNLYVSFKLAPIPDRLVEITLGDVDEGCYRKFRDFDRVRIRPGVATGNRQYVWNKTGQEANLLIKVAPHEDFVRDGDDLHKTVHVPYIGMLINWNYKLRVTPYRAVAVRLRVAYADGRRVRLTGQGLPNYADPQRRGDIYLTFVATGWGLTEPEPTSRWGRLASAIHKSAIGVAKGIGVVVIAIQETINACRALRTFVSQNWETIRVILIVLAALAGLAGIGWVVYFIIANIQTILVAIGLTAVAVLLISGWMKSNGLL